MRVLVIGATGFVGSHVARALAAAGHAVTGFRRPTSTLENLRGLDLGWLEGDVRDAASIRRAVAGQQAVVLAAGIPPHGLGSRDQLHATNVLGARNVARACLDASARLVHVGSAAVYAGSPRLEPADETGGTAPERYDSPAVTSLALGEAEVLRAAAAGLDSVRLCPTLVVGPKDRCFHSSWLLAGVARAWFGISPPGGLNLVPVEDVARAVALALEKAPRGAVYLLGGENVANQALLDLVHEVLHSNAGVLKIPRGPYRALGSLAHALGAVSGKGRLGEVPLDGALARATTLYWFVDSSRAERELGWKAGPIRPALEAQAAWLRERGALPRA